MPDRNILEQRRHRAHYIRSAAGVYARLAFEDMRKSQDATLAFLDEKIKRLERIKQLELETKKES